MTQNLTFYVKYKNNSAVGVETHFNTAGEGRNRPLNTVGHLISAYKTSVAPRFASTPTDELTLHLPTSIISADDYSKPEFSKLCKASMDPSTSPPLKLSTKLSSPLFSKIDEDSPFIIISAEDTGKIKIDSSR